jgi:hypothetical protein
LLKRHWSRRCGLEEVQERKAQPARVRRVIDLIAQEKCGRACRPRARQAAADRHAEPLHPLRLGQVASYAGWWPIRALNSGRTRLSGAYVSRPRIRRRRSARRTLVSSIPK